MPPVKQDKKMPLAPKSASKSKVRSVPDFSKLHNKWSNQLESGKACAKKPCTVAHEFNLSRPVTRGRKMEQKCLNEPQESNEVSIKTTNIPMPTKNTKASKGGSAVARKGGKPSTRNDVKEPDGIDDDFKVDVTALQSIMDNTGVTQASLTENSFKTPSKAAPRFKANTDIRKSMYYTGPRHGGTKGNTAQACSQYVKKVVSRLTTDGKNEMVKLKNVTSKDILESTKLFSSSPLLRGPKFTPARQSIYLQRDRPKHVAASPHSTQKKMPLAGGKTPAQRVARICTKKSPACRTPKSEKQNNRWTTTVGQSPKTTQVPKDNIATTLDFDFDVEDKELVDLHNAERNLMTDIDRLEISRKHRHESQSSIPRDYKEPTKQEWELDNTQTIREIEALLEADLAAGDFDLEDNDLENKPPTGCPQPVWDPAMANKTKHPKNMYENFDKIAQSTLPVSVKTLNRIPFGPLSTREIKKRSLSLSGEDSDESPKTTPKSSPIAAALRTPSPTDKLPKERKSPSSGRKRIVDQENCPPDTPSTPKLQRITPKSNGKTKIYADPESGSPKISLCGLRISDRQAPNSPLANLSPNIKLQHQRSPRMKSGSPSLIKTQSLRKTLTTLDSTDLENIVPGSYRSPKYTAMDKENASPYQSPRIARVLNEDFGSPSRRIAGKSKSPLVPNLSKSKRSYSKQDLNETLSESIIQFESLQMEADTLLSKCEEESPNVILNKLQDIENKQKKLKEIQKKLQLKLLKSASKSRKQIQQKPATTSPTTEEPARVEKKQEDSTNITKMCSPSLSSPESLPMMELPSSSSEEDCSPESVKPEPIREVKAEKSIRISPTAFKRHQNSSLSSVDSVFSVFSPKPKMAGSVQVVNSPVSRESTIFPVPIRTPLAMRNEADKFIPGVPRAIFSSDSSQESLELSIDGVDSSLEILSTDTSAVESPPQQITHEAILNQSKSLRENLSLSFTLGKSSYSSPSSSFTSVTTSCQKTVTTPVKDSLSLYENLMKPVSPFYQRTALANRIAVANARLQFEEALLNDEVSLYASRLSSESCSHDGSSARPVDPVAKILESGDDTHIVPIASD